MLILTMLLAASGCSSTKNGDAGNSSQPAATEATTESAAPEASAQAEASAAPEESAQAEESSQPAEGGDEDIDWEAEMSGSVKSQNLITGLYNLAKEKGADVSIGENTNILSYEDADKVTEDNMEAVQWAVAAGLIGEGSTLEPEKELTREEFFSLLYSFAKWMKLDTSVGEDTNILSYDDATEISDGKAEAFQWAAGAGMTITAEGNLLKPTEKVEFKQVELAMDELWNIVEK